MTVVAPLSSLLLSTSPATMIALHALALLGRNERPIECVTITGMGGKCALEPGFGALKRPVVGGMVRLYEMIRWRPLLFADICG